MTNRSIASAIFTFILCISNTFAQSGYLFNVVPSGLSLPETVSFTLCLNINGASPISCQNYITTKSTLTIKTTP